MQLAVFISGKGSNFKSLLNSIESGKLKAEICCVISNKEEAEGLNFAREKNIEFLAAKTEEEWLTFIKKHTPDYICLAGFMKILSADFIKKVQIPVINIHPSLLPSFKGLHAQEQATRYGVTIAGATVHYVAEEVDAGEVIAQAAISLNSNLNISEQILKAEHLLYTYALNKISKSENLKELKKEAYEIGILIN